MMRMITCCAAMLLAWAPAALAGVSAEALESALRYLPGYAQGDDRLPLTHIEYAIADCQGDAERLARFESYFIEVLNDREAELDAKRFIMRRLAVIGTAASALAIAAHLDTDGLADYAVRALEATGTPEAGVLLREALEEGRGPQDSIVRVLGARADDESLAALFARLQRQLAEGDDDAAHTATALSAFSAAHCSELLEHFEAASIALGDAVLQCAEHAAAAGQEEEAAAAYRSLWDHSETPALREAALQALAVHAPEAAQAAAMDAVSSGDDALYRAALGTLRKLDNSNVALPDGVNVAVLAILAGTGHDGAVEVLRSVAKDQDAPQRSGAVEALGRFGDAQDVPLLLSAIGDSAELRRLSRAALAILPGGTTTDAALVEEAVSGEHGREALSALENRRANAQAPVLLERMVKAEHGDRDRAIDAIGVVGGPDEAQAFLDLMQDGAYEADRQRMGRAAAEIIARSEDAGLVNTVVDLAGQSGDAQVGYIEVVGILTPDEGLDVLTELSRSRDTELRAAAVGALVSWPNTDALEALEHVARRRASGAQQPVALEGYVRLLRTSDLSAEDRAERYEEALRFHPDTAGKRRIISALAEAVTPAALEAVGTLKDDADVQAEAATAVVQLSRALSAAYPELAREHLKPYLQRDEGDGLRNQAEATLALIDGFQDYIVGWQVAGPYYGEGLGGGDLFERSHPPQTAPDAVAWRVLPAPTKPDRPAWYLDLFEEMGGFERAAYLRTRVYAPEAQTARLELGSDDGVKAWLNGDLVHKRMVLRTAAPADDVVEVQLKEGWNDLMLGVYQLGSDWGAVARLAAPDGSAIEGLRVALP